MSRVSYPIAELLPRIRTVLAGHTRLVLVAPPGAGKTTQVPAALLDEAWLSGRRIVMLEPRRVAVRVAAGFMAAQRGEAVGQTVGYRIRFEARESDATRILVVTEGILTRMLQADPELPGVGAILFDEFHERHLAGDLGATLALDVQAGLRPDLRIVVMSATLDGARIGAWLDAPVLASEGRTFAVHIEHPAGRAGDSELLQLRRATQQALAETDGDVLVFLPGRREIAQAERMLRNAPLRPIRPQQQGAREVVSPHPEAIRPGGERIEVLPLHGELPVAEQQAVLASSEPGMRRVILATNVAESSVTVPGVRAVVDTGLAREPRFDPNSGLTRLATVHVSQASADQRAGRAGRVAPGVAYRLWPQSRRLERARTPEIAQADLSGLVLELAAWGVGEDAASALCWLDRPPIGALAAARALLQMLGALDDAFHATPLGREMLRLGTHPRMAAAALRAPVALRPLVADLLGLLEPRSPLRAGGRDDDLRARLEALHRLRDGGARAANGVDTHALAAIETVTRAWRKRLGVRHGASGTPDALAVGNLLLHAFPDRAGQRDDGDPRRYLLANGRGARLHDASALIGEPWLVVADARFDARDSLILAAAPFDPRLLQTEYSDRIVSERVVRQDRDGLVEVFEVERCGAIVLSRRARPVTAEDALPALLGTIRARGIDSLPWSDAVRRLRARTAWLRCVLPDADLPDVSDAALLASLETWLAPSLAGKRKLAALSSRELSDAFAALLDYRQRKLLDAAAPDAIAVPSGRTIRLDYSVPVTGEDASPVLRVKLQELFGLAATPRVGNGRVPVTLHLLSPAGRPIQVTQDLAGFWARTYAEVKKELKGRYPRHPWPDDPWHAAPTHRAKPRR